MANENSESTWKKTLSTIVSGLILSGTGGFVGGYLAIQQNLATLDKRMSIAELQIAEVQKDVEKREQSIKELMIKQDIILEKLLQHMYSDRGVKP